MLRDEDMMDFFFDKNPVGIIVFDGGMNSVLSNKRGKYFLKHHVRVKDIGYKKVHVHGLHFNFI